MNYPNEDCIRVLSIDPGSNMCGFSIMDWNVGQKTGTIQYAHTVDSKEALSALGDALNIMRHTHDDKALRLYGYAKVLSRLMDEYMPTIIGSESPYMGKFPQAFRTLAELTFLFRLTVSSKDSLANFVFVDPSGLKKFMKVPGNNGDKELMKKALISREDLFYANGIDPHSLDEHSIDSICVGYWLANEIS